MWVFETLAHLAHTNKHITTGEGEMVFTNNTNLAKKSRNLEIFFWEEKIFSSRDWLELES